jgi:hypothetical protein
VQRKAKSEGAELPIDAHERIRDYLTEDEFLALAYHSWCIRTCSGTAAGMPHEPWLRCPFGTFVLVFRVHFAQS